MYPILMSFFGTVPFAVTFGAYVGFLLVGAVFVAIGIFTSSLTENQVVAAVSGIVALLIMYFMQSIGATIGGVLGTILMWASPLSRFSEFASGIMNFASVIFYISFTGVMLLITVMNLERKRWS